MDTSMNMNDASIAHSEPSNPVQFDGDSMDVDEVPATTTGPYKLRTKPVAATALNLPEDFEEEEAEMSSDEDDDGDEDDEAQEGKSTEISAAILLDKTIEEMDDADDTDYVPPE